MSDVADICFIAEGSYPFVSGGVSSWMHQMITELDDKTFHVVSLMPSSNGFEHKYTLPKNVINHEVVYLQSLDTSRKIPSAKAEDIHERLRPLLYGLIDGVPFNSSSLASLVKIIASYRGKLSQEALLDSRAAWDTLLDTYQQGYEHLSFLDYFWTYRVMLSGLASTLVCDLPAAKVYHSASTGFSGLLAARAKAETGSPVILTEHGIYTNERRIEIVAADWLQQTHGNMLTVEHMDIDLRDMWMRFFHRIGKLCYESSDEIVTLFADNQKAQINDGADRSRMSVIPNGVDVGHLTKLKRDKQSVPTIGLIGRVVPIKDVKSFLQSVAMLVRSIPEMKAYIMGPTDEDPTYVQECRDLAEYLGLSDVVEFTGQVDIDDHLPKMDVVVLTSISEAQPLVLLEAGACGVPVVAPDVGACNEIINGSIDERPALGAGGILTPLANPEATARAIHTLLTDARRYEQASEVLKKRVEESYNKERQYNAYRELYNRYMD